MRNVFGGILYVSILIFCSDVNAQKVFGPETLAGSPTNEIYLRQFEAHPSNDYILAIQNGEYIDIADCSAEALPNRILCKLENLFKYVHTLNSRVKQINIELNNQTVFSDMDFHRSIEIEKVITLQQLNTLRFALRGSTESFIKIKIRGTRILQPPTPVLTATPQSGMVPLFVSFSAQGSFNPNGGNIVGYEWNFGDGATASGVLASHTYQAVGEYTVALTVTSSDNLIATTFIVVRVLPDTIAPIIQISSPSPDSLIPSLIAQVSGSSNESLSELTVNGREIPLSADNLSFSGIYTSPDDGFQTLTFEARDLAGNLSTQSFTVEFAPDAANLPPDPASVAPPLAEGVMTSLAESTAFLYSGDNPVQTGVRPGTISELRAAAVRGRVVKEDRSPLRGVKVHVVGHPEFGETLTRIDGFFDLAFNSSTNLTLAFEKTGYFRVHHTIKTPAQVYGGLKDIIMVQADARVTTIDLSSPNMKVARGTTITDEAGTRTATLLVPPNITALIRLPDGTAQPVTTLNLRMTEFTVGEDGPERMPAELPPSTGYTYAVEITADEAIAVNAKSIEFDAPVYYYVDNFIGFPVGAAVPCGYYNYEEAKWQASPDGRVLGILDIQGGFAVLDVNGSGLPASSADLLAMGITDLELQQLANLYFPGQSFWRTPLTHFSLVDLNFFNRLNLSGPTNYTPIDYPLPIGGDDNPPDAPICSGSAINVYKQSISESIPISGTEYSLNYASDRVHGNLANNSFQIQISGPEVRSDLEVIEVTFEIAGKRYTETYPGGPNLFHNFTWDGRDAFGRTISTAMKGSGLISYLYRGVYEIPEYMFGTSFGFPYKSSIGYFKPVSRDLISFAVPFEVTLGSKINSDFSGWSLNNNHFYDPLDEKLYMGDRRVLDAKSLPELISVYAGSFDKPRGTTGDDTHRLDTTFNQIDAMTATPDGTLYVADVAEDYSAYIRKIDPVTGIVTTVAGTNLSNPIFNVSDPLSLKFYFPSDLASLEAGTFYIAAINTNGLSTLYKISNGVVSQPFAVADQIIAVAIDRRNGIYFTNGSIIRYRNPDGVIKTILGGGNLAPADGLPALDVTGFVRIHGLSLDADDNLYFADNYNKIIKVTRDGVLDFFGGQSPTKTFCDSRPGDSANNFYGNIRDLTVSTTNILVLATENGVLKIGPDSSIIELYGKNRCALRMLVPGNDGPAVNAAFISLRALAVDGKNNIYISEYNGFNPYTDKHIIRKISPALPTFTGEGHIVASPGADEVFVFDRSGRHLETRTGLTGALKYKFDYDINNKLIAVHDRDENVTTVTRDAIGSPVTISSPYGLVTTLSTNADGYLETVKDPTGATHAMGYKDEKGLMSRFVKPNGAITSFQYDNLGRLIRDQGAVGNFLQLDRVALPNNTFAIQLSTAEGYHSSFQLQNIYKGDRRVNVDSTGNYTTVSYESSGDVTTVTPDLVNYSSRTNGDPRFGLNSQFDSKTTKRMPSGNQLTMTTSKSVSLFNPQDIFSINQLTQQTVLNSGLIYTSVFNGTTRQWTHTTPQGRTTTVTLDPKEKPVQIRWGNISPTNFSYDERGRLSQIAQDTRITSMIYNEQGFVSEITKSQDQTTRFAYDGAGRIISRQLPDNRVIDFAYDLNGNLTSVTPPGRPAHIMDYDLIDQLIGYSTPTPAGTTQYTYNLDRQLTSIQRPGGLSANFNYDPVSGKLLNVVDAHQTTTIDYNSSGQILTKATGSGDAMDYQYDGSLLTRVNYRLGATSLGYLQIGYNTDFQMSSYSVNGSPITYGYYSDGLVRFAGSMSFSFDLINGLLESRLQWPYQDNYTYNNFGELTGYSSVGGYSYSLTRDDLGRVSNKTETIGGVTSQYSYTYDLASRLTGVTKNGVLVSSYSYDSNSNRLTGIANGVTASGIYDSQDKMLSYGDNTYSYSANGDLLSKSNTLGVTSYTYDVFGNLRRVVLPNSTVIEYIINSENNRIGKKVNGVVVQRFLYFGSRLIAELNASNQLVSRFVYATKSHVPDFMIKNGLMYQFVTDHLGSIRLVIQNGQIVQQIDYDEFGVLLNDTNPGLQPFGFAGGLYDRDTGLVRFGARDYDSEVGRFASKDPILFWGGDSNLYGYAMNDPVNFIDPTGLDFRICSRPLNMSLPSSDPFRHYYTRFDDGSTASYGVDENGNPTQLNEPDHPAGERCGENIKSTPDENQMMKDWANQHYRDPYNVLSNNCKDFTGRMTTEPWRNRMNYRWPY